MSQTTSLPQPHLPETIPMNLYKQAAPLKARLIENTRLTDADSANDVRHLVFDLTEGNYPYLDGQSAGILPPGTDAEGKPHKLRLYSIASPSVGDDGQGKTLSLCVKRANWTDPETGIEYKGVCSNYLNDLKVGDEVNMTGPVGKGFLMPEMANANMIMMATGTGIAPFRAFLHNRYHQRANESGESWLIFGVQTRKDYLYKEELEAYRSHKDYNLVTAFSREEKTADGGKMYIQHRVREHRAALLNLLQQPNTVLYMCGLRGMETGIIEVMDQAAQEQGLVWADLLAQLKAEKRWRIEVY